MVTWSDSRAILLASPMISRGGKSHSRLGHPDPAGGHARALGLDTGCGTIAVLTDRMVDQLPDDRTPLRLAIERAIPLSAGAANNRIEATAKPRVAELEDLPEKAGFDPAQRVGR